jgi:hypothetical protein
MKKQVVIGITILGAMAGSSFGQTMQRRASMVGGGGPDRGKCTVEVVVDGAAQVEIRGDSATLKNLQGQSPQWRRFECSSPLPANPANFRFAGVDGRGSQQLVRDPRNGGSAVVQINDPDNGAEGYTFDIFWGGREGNAPPVDRDRGRPEYRTGDPGFGGGRRPMSREDAMRPCQEAVRQQAAERYNAHDIQFRRVEGQDIPGAADSVTGFFDVRKRDGDLDGFRFTCSVNFESGQVFNARIDPVAHQDGDRGGFNRLQQGDRDRDDRGARDGGDRAMGGCQRAVEARISQDGFGSISIDSIRRDNDRPGFIVGNARAQARSGGITFGFSCVVEPDGDVRSVDVRAR